MKNRIYKIMESTIEKEKNRMSKYWFHRFLMADKRAKKWRKEVKQQKALIAYSEWLSKRRLNYWTDADLYRAGWKFLTMILLGIVTILLI